MPVRLALLYALLVAQVALAKPSRTLPMDVEASSTVASKPACMQKVMLEDACLRAFLHDEAIGFLTGDRNTLAEDLVASFPTKPPEMGLLKGINIRQFSKVPERCSAVVEREKGRALDERCVCAAMVVDLGRWTRRQPSGFGEALSAIQRRHESYRSLQGFQRARWGMTVIEVSRLYPSATRVASGDLGFKASVAGLDGAVRFLFVDGRLWSVLVAFDEDPTRPDLDVQKDRELRRLLTQRYGKPTVVDGQGADRTSPLDRAMTETGGLGRAVRAGRLALKATWTTTEMEVTLSLGESAGSYAHLLVYRSAVFAERAKTVAEAKRAAEL